MTSAQYWIDHLGLTAHPEGGFYKETYRAGETTHEGRAVSTGIYFLLRSHEFSHLHRIDADEMWHFYAGTALTVHMIDEMGGYSALNIGGSPEAGEAFQAVVPAGVWFGATVDRPDAYALVGCTVAPGFEFSKFEMAERGVMLDAYPQHADIITRLTET